MSLFDDASLAMIPSAYKDGKLYSIKPTDGSGDFTFSRGSNLAATRVDENGLIEKGRENLLLRSNQFDTTWINSSTTEIGGQVGYDGSNDAWLLTKTGTFGFIRQALSSSGVQTLSVYAKANDSDWIRFYVDGVGSLVYFNLSTGVLGATSNVIDSNIESIGNGWYRCSIAFSGNATQVNIYPAEENSVSATSGSIYIQDAQVEAGLVATDYIETTTTTAQAGILEDMPRLDYSGGASCPSLLLEPQRTNLFDNSEYIDGWSTSDTGVSIEENATTSPEGVVNAAKIKEDATNAAHAVRQLTGPTLTSGTDYTFSFFAKKGERSIVALSNTIGASNDANCFFDLDNGQILTNTFNSASIEDFGNGWYRCIATDTADANDDYDTRIYTATADNQFSHQGVSGSGLYIYGLQLESGSYPTSYIPCYGAATTRSGDMAEIIPLSTNIVDTSLAHTGFIEIKANAKGVAGYQVWGIDDGLYNNFIKLYIDSSLAKLRLGYRDSLGNVNYSNFGNIGDYSKFAWTYDGVGEFKFYVDGVLTSTHSAVMNSFSTFGYGEKSGQTNYTNTSTKQIALFPTALTDSECIALTTL